MKKLTQTFDYLFYCTYHFMMKIRKTEDRVDDVVWIFSGFFSIPLFGIIFQLWGYFFENKVVNTRPNFSYLGALALILAFGSIYITDKYFTNNAKYKAILIQYGKYPSKKDLITGFLFFCFCVGIVGVVAIAMFLFMKLTH